MYNILSVEVPAGEYFVGDPCYGVPADRWMEWLHAADYENAHPMLVAELDGKTVVGVSTAYGDGTYDGSDGEGYPVDSGLIGVVPVELVEEDSPWGMNKVSFANPFTCSYNDGTITIGHITIETGDEGDEY